MKAAIPLALAILASPVAAGPVAWGLCYTACNAGYGVCLGALGLVAGEQQRAQSDTKRRTTSY
jgi:hypothetical protein